MFTNNYIKYREMMFYGRLSYLLNPGFKNVAGIEVYGSSNNSDRGDLGNWLTRGRCRTFVESGSNEDKVFPGVYFGSGSTPATRADYKLAAPITSGLVITDPSAVITETQKDHKRILHSTFLVKNTSGSEKIIWEVGVFTPVCQTGSTCYLVLMDRVVLDKPITIPAGETRAVTYQYICRHLLELE